jgi:hypothetical protein
MDDRFQVQLFGGHHRETIFKVETHLVAKHTYGTGSGSVVLLRAGFQYMPHQIEILFHFLF